MVNAAEEMVKRACDEFIKRGIQRCGGAKFEVVGYRHSEANSELDQEAKIDIIIYVKLYFSNNPFDGNIVNLILQVKARSKKKEMVSENASERRRLKAEKKQHKKINERLYHQYCNPWVPVVVVFIGADGKPIGLNRALKKIICQTAARSIRAAIKARKLKI